MTSSNVPEKAGQKSLARYFVPSSCNPHQTGSATVSNVDPINGDGDERAKPGLGYSVAVLPQCWVSTQFRRSGPHRVPRTHLPDRSGPHQACGRRRGPPPSEPPRSSSHYPSTPRRRQARLILMPGRTPSAPPDQLHPSSSGLPRRQDVREKRSPAQWPVRELDSVWGSASSRPEFVTNLTKDARQFHSGIIYLMIVATTRTTLRADTATTTVHEMTDMTRPFAH